MTEGSDPELAALRVIEDVLFSRDVVERHMRGGTIIDRNAHAASVRDAVRSALRAALPARSDAGLRTALGESIGWIAKYEEAMGHSYCDSQVGGGWASEDCTCGFDAMMERWRAALAAADHGFGDGTELGEGLDVERLTKALEDAPIWDPDDGDMLGPIEDIAAKVAAEYQALSGAGKRCRRRAGDGEECGYPLGHAGPHHPRARVERDPEDRLDCPNCGLRLTAHTDFGCPV